MSLRIIIGVKKATQLHKIVQYGAMILASNHMQSFNKFHIQDIIEKSYIDSKGFEQQVVNVAMAFARQTEND